MKRYSEKRSAVVPFSEAMTGQLILVNAGRRVLHGHPQDPQPTTDSLAAQNASSRSKQSGAFTVAVDEFLVKHKKQGTSSRAVEITKLFTSPSNVVRRSGIY